MLLKRAALVGAPRASKVPVELLICLLQVRQPGLHLNGSARRVAQYLAGAASRIACRLLHKHVRIMSQNISREVWVSGLGELQAKPVTFANIISFGKHSLTSAAQCQR